MGDTPDYGQIYCWRCAWCHGDFGYHQLDIQVVDTGTAARAHSSWDSSNRIDCACIRIRTWWRGDTIRIDIYSWMPLIRIRRMHSKIWLCWHRKRYMSHCTSSESACSERAASVPDGGGGFGSPYRSSPHHQSYATAADMRGTTNLWSCVIMYVIIGPRTSSSVGYEAGGDGV